MFQPNYIISDKLLKALVDLESARSVIDLMPVTADWRNKLFRETKVKKVYNSLRFVGNSLSIDYVSSLVNYDPGRDETASEVALAAGVTGKESDVQQVINWMNASKYRDQLAYLGTKYGTNPMSEKELAKLNSLLSEKLVEYNRLGIYRMQDVPSGFESRIKCIPAIEVTYRVDDFLKWLGGKKEVEMHPVILAGVVFATMLKTCPFESANFLSSWLLSSLVLEEEKYGLGGLVSFEDYLFRNREVVSMYLGSVDEQGGDLTRWLEFFAKSVASAALETKSKIMMLMGDTPVFRTETGKAISLSDRQLIIMEDVSLRNNTSIKEIRTLIPSVSDDTLLRDLNDLIEKKLLKKKGKTKGAVYVLGKIKSFRQA